MKICFRALLATLQLISLSSTAQESPNREVSKSQEPPPQASSVSPRAPAHDGSHDFDFLIGNWKAHVRRLPDRLVGSNNWIEYNGISNHKSCSIRMRTLRSSRSIILRASAHQRADASDLQSGIAPVVDLHSRAGQSHAEPAAGGWRVQWKPRRVL